MPYYQNTNSHFGSLRFIRDKLKNKFMTKIMEPSIKVYVTEEPVTFDQRTEGKYKKLRRGDVWGKIWDCGWFHVTGDFTAVDSHNMVLIADLNGEACVFDDDGCPVKGLTTHNSRMCTTLGNVGKTVYELPPQMAREGRLDLWIEAGCNDLFSEKPGIVNEMAVALRHPGLRELYYDIAVLLDLCDVLDRNGSRFSSIIRGLTEATHFLRDYTEEEAALALAFTKPLLSLPAAGGNFSVSAIGHAHLDLVWTWPQRETIRKVARTFSTTLYHMERYPDYRFGASQMQLYAWVQERYPALFNKILPRIAEGRWEVQGGMWCECDVNVTGGESLIRQLLYGKQYSRRELGCESFVAWLPDTFGYTAALPQIIKKSGIDYLCIQKIRTNVTNIRYPHDSFYWEGLDGTQVLVHVPPLLYSSAATPSEVYRTEREYKDKWASDSALMLFGQGDGGGGAGAEHLESLKRVQDLSGIVPVCQRSALEFFENLSTCNGLKKWVGPLDLDRHTGTLTSAAKAKSFNHKLEITLRRVEWLASTAYIQHEYPYPREKFASIWHDVLLYQFHDCLPGTSIGRVYAECYARYEEMLAELREIEMDCLSVYKDDTQIQAFNPTAYERREWMLTQNGWMFVSALPFTVAKSVDAPEVFIEAKDGCIENEYLSINFDNQGAIISVFDKEQQQECLSAPANRLAVYYDRVENGSDPWNTSSSAWDFPQHYDQKAPDFFRLENIQYTVDGPKASAHMRYSLGYSTLTQVVSLMSCSRVIKFDTECDWQETGKMLRTSFPVEIKTREITRGVQFGQVRDALHHNTEWQEFMEELCVQRYADLSEAGYGVALLTGHKYGLARRRGAIDLCLLRSPEYPQPDLDRGIHHFTYALYPHIGDEAAGDVARQANLLTNPLIPVLRGPAQPLFTVEGAMVEAVKLAEEDNSLIIRIYEPYGRRGTAKLDIGFEIKSYHAVNLMEEIEETEHQFSVSGQSITTPIQPFEIISLKITLEEKTNHGN